MGLTGLGTITICANFHNSGQYERRRLLLLRIVRKVIAFFGRSLSTFPEMRSYSDALRTLVSASASTTSLGEKDSIDMDIWQGMSRKAEIAASVGFGRWLGVNTC